MRTVLRTDDLAEAYRARDLLREHGISAEVSVEPRAAGGIVPLDIEPAAEVWIADEGRIAEARALVAELGRAEPAPDWTCACGESNPGAFTACPSCGADRPG